jgi:hypothetical protein
MMHRRFKVNDWHCSIPGECLEHRIGTLFVPVLQRRKRSYTDGRTITLEHANKLGNVFSLIGIHHRARAMLESPARSAWLEHDGISAEFINSDLHRRTRAQAGIEEHERHRLPSERL